MTKYSKVIDLNNILSIKIINHRLRQIVRDAICLRKVVWYIYLSTSMRLDSRLWFTLTGFLNPVSVTSASRERMVILLEVLFTGTAVIAFTSLTNMSVAMATTLESRYKGEIG
jgi:hypothetical protein